MFAPKLPTLTDAIARLETKLGPGLTDSQQIIPEEVSFRGWCDQLSEAGLKVDGKPFRLDNRPCMAWIYDQFPTTREEAFGMTLVIRKCAQVGFTVMEMLAGIYYALKFSPCFVGFYLPDMKLAGAKSTHRFMPVIRTIPDAYNRLRATDSIDGVKRGEGNVMIRQMGESRFHFLWTSGKAMTESFPMDVLSFDEVQEMLVADMEATQERMSGSSIRFCMMGSTAKWPDADIDYWYKLGTRHAFWTRCPHCHRHQRMDEEGVFPKCIRFDDLTDEYRYICVSCGGWIDDPQYGEWRAENEEALTHSGIKSITFHQMLSPTVSAREVLTKYERATSMQNFYNRVLGRPYTDPSEIPINMEVLNKCVEAGRAENVQWKSRASHTFMGLDQMGHFNVAVVKERLPSGRQGVIHVEEIFSDDPFARCDELMANYGVEVCCVETLPNYNDAKRFAARHLGRVFLAQYGDLKDDQFVWGDAVVSKADRKTELEERDRYVVTLNQYKCMQTAFGRLLKQTCLFPDPDGLRQEIIEKGQRRVCAVLREHVFLHFTKTALVVERSEEAKKKYLKEFRTRVVKVGIDPHFSYANMLCDVAWARINGTGSLILPGHTATEEKRKHAEAMNMPGLPIHIVDMIRSVSEAMENTCGACEAYDSERKFCRERTLLVRAEDPGCPVFVRYEAP
jgi:hypothetical protein